MISDDLPLWKFGNTNFCKILPKKERRKTAHRSNSDETELGCSPYQGWYKVCGKIFQVFDKYSVM